MTEKLQDFFNIFEIPDFIAPWIDRFFTDTEIDLVIHLAKEPLTREEINQTFSPRTKSDNPEDDTDLATRAYRKGIINQCEDGRFKAADFHTRYDKWALFEGWMDIPDEIRTQLNDWELAHYINQHSDQISSLKNGVPRDRAGIYPEYLLLHEAEALLDRVKNVYLMPCNCRCMMQNCSQSIYTCLRFGNDRDKGWEISKSRAKEIVYLANKQGLMQSGEVGLGEDGAIKGAICNCCADCCYPHILGEHLDAQKLWPLSRYLARHLEDRCNACGRCVKRCPFDAFTIEKHPQGSKVETKSIGFDKERCRGCGVCSTACPEEAIEMIAIESRRSLISEILS